jgi:hypothetical protein
VEKNLREEGEQQLTTRVRYSLFDEENVIDGTRGVVSLFVVGRDPMFQIYLRISRKLATWTLQEHQQEGNSTIVPVDILNNN